MEIIQVLKDINLEIDPDHQTVTIVFNTIPYDPNLATRHSFDMDEWRRVWQAAGRAVLKLGDCNGQPLSLQPVSEN